VFVLLTAALGPAEETGRSSMEHTDFPGRSAGARVGVSCIGLGDPSGVTASACGVDEGVEAVVALK
jgi:hypothetical protein